MEFLLRSGFLRSKPAADVWHSPIARPRDQGVQVVNSAGALRLPKWGSEELLLLEAGAPADAGAKALAGEAGVRAGA